MVYYYKIKLILEVITLKKIKENIFSVGGFDPALRVFDIVMSAEYGTSYNSYIVRGSEKTALIEACHEKLYDSYIENIKEVCELSNIDIIVLNHNEPDHTGSVARLVQEIPNVEVYTTKVGAVYLSAITNSPDINIHTVKSGETIDLGGKTLEFIQAPNLHWPDSMFTYIKEDKAVFTCDFLGAHYCEPSMLDSGILHTDCYDIGFKNYYDAIFAPFKPFVLQGLEKLSQLDFDIVLPSHGPVLTRSATLDNALERYREWSTVAPRERKLIPVFYTSAYGNTEKLAFAIAEGIRSVADFDVETYDIIEHDHAKLAGIINECDGVAIGTPTLNRDAVEPVWALLSSISAINSAKKPALVFGSYGWSGEGVPNVAQRLASLKFRLVNDGYKVVFTPTEENIAQAREIGVQLGEACK